MDGRRKSFRNESFHAPNARVDFDGFGGGCQVFFVRAKVASAQEDMRNGVDQADQSLTHVV